MSAAEAEYQFSQLLTLIDPNTDIEKKYLYTGLKELSAGIDRLERQIAQIKSSVRSIKA